MSAQKILCVSIFIVAAGAAIAWKGCFSDNATKLGPTRIVSGWLTITIPDNWEIKRTEKDDTIEIRFVEQANSLVPVYLDIRKSKYTNFDHPRSEFDFEEQEGFTHYFRYDVFSAGEKESKKVRIYRRNIDVRDSKCPFSQVIFRAHYYGKEISELNQVIDSMKFKGIPLAEHLGSK